MLHHLDMIHLVLKSFECKLIPSEGVFHSELQHIFVYAGIVAAIPTVPNHPSYPGRSETRLRCVVSATHSAYQFLAKAVLILRLLFHTLLITSENVIPLCAIL